MKTAPPLERRFAAECEIRVSGSGKAVRAQGYAAMFGKASRDLGGFREMIAPTAFTRALNEKQDVAGLVNHDASRLLGRTSSGTLKLSADSRGLAFDCLLPDTTYARDLAEMMSRGDMNKCSFAFRAVTDSWRKVDGQAIRELQDVDLIDISIVTDPAYLDTEASLRSVGGIDGERVAAELRKLNSPPPTGTPLLDAARIQLAELTR